MYTVVDRFETDYEVTQELIAHVVDCIFCDDGSRAQCEVVDGNTGEVLFTYRNGNVTYIEGEFAKQILRFIRNQHR